MKTYTHYAHEHNHQLALQEKHSHNAYWAHLNQTSCVQSANNHIHTYECSSEDHHQPLQSQLAPSQYDAPTAVITDTRATNVLKYDTTIAEHAKETLLTTDNQTTNGDAGTTRTINDIINDRITTTSQNKSNSVHQLRQIKPQLHNFHFTVTKIIMTPNNKHLS